VIDGRKIQWLSTESVNLRYNTSPLVPISGCCRWRKKSCNFDSRSSVSRNVLRRRRGSRRRNRDSSFLESRWERLKQVWRKSDFIILIQLDSTKRVAATIQNGLYYKTLRVFEISLSVCLASLSSLVLCWRVRLEPTRVKHLSCDPL